MKVSFLKSEWNVVLPNVSYSILQSATGWNHEPNTSRSSAAAIPSFTSGVDFNISWATELQPCLKLNFYSCSFIVVSSLFSKLWWVGASTTSAGNLLHRLSAWMVKKFCLSPFSVVCCLHYYRFFWNFFDRPIV